MNIHITRLNDWLTCKRKGYLAGLYEIRTQQEWMRTGSYIHAAIAHHTDPRNHLYPQDIDDYSKAIFDHYCKWLADNSEYAGKAVSTDNWHYQNEVAFCVPIAGTKHFAQGHIDSLVYDPGTKETYLLEYKTTTSLATRAEQVLNEIQPIWYALAAQQLGYKIDKIVYHLIRKKVPNTRSNADTTHYLATCDQVGAGRANTDQNYFAQVVVPMARYDLEIWQNHIVQMVQDYTSVQGQYPRFGYHCRWCQFSDVCSLMQRQDTTEHALALLDQQFKPRLG